MSKSNKPKNRKTIHIEWGDCDPAQIVYLLRYFFYFDGCTAALFKKAGLSKRELIKRYKIVGRRASIIHAALTALRVSDYRIRNPRVATE